MANTDINISQYLMQKKYTCPLCDAEFTSLSVRSSKLRLVKSDTDLRARYDNIDPIYYDIVICDKCGYTAMSSFFSKLTQAQAKLVTQEITSRFIPRIYQEVYSTTVAIDRYKIALACTFAKNGKASEKAYICLKLSWLYADKENILKQDFFLLNAHKYFSMALATESAPFCGMDDMTLMYLLGEISRQLGFLDEAAKFISSVIVNRNIPARLKNRALDIKELIRIDQENKEKG